MCEMIFFSLQPFDMETSIFVEKEPGLVEKIASVPINELAEAIPTYCYHLDTYKVHIFGIEDFINGYIADIKVCEGLQFSKDKIEFEVN